MGKSGSTSSRAARRREERARRRRGGEPAAAEAGRRGLPFVVLLLLGAFVLVGAVAWIVRPGTVPVDGYRVVSRRPHDPDAYCQGLLFSDGRLFESTGRYERSEVREVDPGSGEVLRRRRLSAKEFGEGLAAVGQELFQLTWRAGRLHVYGRDDLAPRRTLDYEGEGWGLTYDGRHLVMSDGSDVLTFRDPGTFAVVRRLEVTAAGKPVRQLNELEFVDGEIFANVYRDDRIARIDPETGEVRRWIDLEGLLGRDDRRGGEDVLNGIAWDAGARRLFVTGKLWPLLYEIEIVEGG